MMRMDHRTPAGKYAWTVRVGDKGQIVIPKEAREVFDICPGDTLLLLGDADRGIAIPPKGMAEKIYARIMCFAKHDGAEMDESGEGQETENECS